MDKDAAYRIIERFARNDNPSADDEFAYIEACNFLIETENDNEVMANLGGYYYEKQKYELAEKYYLMAHENGNTWAADGLGYIYYYGRTGARDYQKAMHYYSISAENGNLEAKMKIADMFHNGYGVEVDQNKYKTLLLEIYDKVKNTKNLFDPYPEVAHRLADICIQNGDNDTATKLLTKGKSFITQRIRYNPFWGNFIVCKRTINLYYSINPFDVDDFNFFDLFYLLSEPHKVKLTFHGRQYFIESYFDEGEMRVKCDNILYKSVENFLSTALFDHKHTYVIDYEEPYFLDLVD